MVNLQDNVIAFEKIESLMQQSSDLDSELITSIELICYYVIGCQIKTMREVNDANIEQSERDEMRVVLYNNMKNMMDCVSNLEYSIYNYQPIENREQYENVHSYKVELVRKIEDIKRDLYILKEDVKNNAR